MKKIKQQGFTLSRSKRGAGFTLIELLVVVAIIAILALVVLLALNPVEMARKSRDSRRLSDLGTLRRSIDLTLADGGSLVTTGGAWRSTAAAGALDPAVATNLVQLNISKYLSTIPADPQYLSGDATAVQVTNACGAAPATANLTKGTMIYEFKSDGNTYVLRTRLESTDNCQILASDGNADVYFETGTAPGLTLP